MLLKAVSGILCRSLGRSSHKLYSRPVSLSDGSSDSLELALNDLVGDTALALLEGLANTGNDLEALSERSLGLVGDDVVLVAKERAALRVTEDDPGDTGLLKLLGRDLAGERTRVDEVGVLSGDLDRGSGVFESLEEEKCGRGNDDLWRGVLDTASWIKEEGRGWGLWNWASHQLTYTPVCVPTFGPPCLHLHSPFLPSNLAALRSSTIFLMEADEPFILKFPLYR